MGVECVSMSLPLCNAVVVVAALELAARAKEVSSCALTLPCKS